MPTIDPNSSIVQHNKAIEANKSKHKSLIEYAKKQQEKTDKTVLKQTFDPVDSNKLQKMLSSETSKKDISRQLPSLKHMSGMILENLIKSHFNNTLFCSGKGTKEKQTIDKLATTLVNHSKTEDNKNYLRTVLDELNSLEKQNKQLSGSVSLPLRAAVLLAAQRTGIPMMSWEAYSVTPLKKDENLWSFLSKPDNFIPEVNAFKAKYYANTYVHAINLSKLHKSPTVAMLKGGFGAGKTQHIKTVYGEEIGKSVISPDAAKNMLRMPLDQELTHSRAHHQASDAAFTQFDELIKKLVGLAVYDSSLGYASDVKDYLIKSEKSNKALEISDITRNDTARALAVLSRPVDGEDPRTPFPRILDAAASDRKQRPDCMNTILHPERYIEGIEIKQHHKYSLFGCDATAADSRLLATFDSTGKIKWAPNGDITKEEAINRMQEQGIRWNKENNQFALVNPEENWKDSLKQQLDKPTGELIQTLNEGERKVRHTVFSQRTLPVTDSNFKSPAEFYEKLNSEFKSCISKEAFTQAFNQITPEQRKNLLTNLQLKIKSSQKKTLSYLDLPASIAISLHAELTGSPWSKASGYQASENKVTKPVKRMH